MLVVIVGGGIVGLTCAISLRHAGHTVHVYERSRFRNELGAAINVLPNSSHALLGFGLDDPVRARLVPSEGVSRWQGDTLEEIQPPGSQAPIEK
jgi:salicylate hydroxylase